MCIMARWGAAPMGTLVAGLVLSLMPASSGKEWAVCLDHSGSQSIHELALSHGFEVLAEVIPESGCFHVKSRPLDRPKRDAGLDSDEDLDLADIGSHLLFMEEQVGHVRTKRRDYHDLGMEDQPLKYGLNDPYWDKMWYLNRADELNMNVEKAWMEGISGQGVAVTILDDGIEKDHPDLIRNYDPLASTDINDNDSDPNPRYDLSDSNRHGTRCAGQVAASPNNSLCGVGVAFNAQIGGIRMLDGQVSDAVEARSLSYNPDHVDIYSSSWGPNDDGKTVDGPGKLAYRAFKNGITRGRSGKGSIFVWASGNGGRYKDNCNCDGYATSIYTITVSSTSESGQIPWYSEACSSTLATTYSSGTSSERQIITTDLHHRCTTTHTGTSASAPMAAGIIALALEANPTLTWRDVQHIIVRTSRPLNLKAPDWRKNALGRSVSHSYGYGLMDAAAMVTTAREWKLVPRQEKCTIASPYYYKVIPAMGYITIELDVQLSDCPSLHHLEHVISPVHVSAGRKRGDLRIYLQSPQGTRSTLLDARPQDYSSSGFIDWPFMTVHSWGENPHGKWILEIHNDAYSKWASDAKFFKWSLTLFGTEREVNSEATQSSQTEDMKFNVVREVPLPAPPPRDMFTNSSSDIASSGPSYPVSEQVAISPKSPLPAPDVPTIVSGARRGCVSKQMGCTRTVPECRTFNHRSVASIFCQCIPKCIEIAPSGEGLFNMQCDMVARDGGFEPKSKSTTQTTTSQTSTSSDTTQEAPASSEADPPMYCKFIPFFNYPA